MPVHPEVLADMARLGIEFEAMDIDPDLADTVDFCEAYGVPLDKSANAILVASRQPPGHNAVCVLLATTRLDVNGTVRRRLGVRKVSFAPADATRELTGQEIGAREAKEIGLVNEVLPKDQVLARAWELARMVMRQPELNRRYTRILLTEQLRRQMNDLLPYGLALEGLAITAI